MVGYVYIAAIDAHVNENECEEINPFKLLLFKITGDQITSVFLSRVIQLDFS